MHPFVTPRIYLDRIDFKNSSNLRFMAGFEISEVGFQLWADLILHLSRAHGSLLKHLTQVSYKWWDLREPHV